MVNYARGYGGLTLSSTEQDTLRDKLTALQRFIGPPLLSRRLVHRTATAFIATLTAVSSAVSMPSQIEQVPKDGQLSVRDFCKYDLSDYPVLNKLVETEVRREDRAEEATEVLKRFKNFQLVGILELPQMRNGAFVRGDGQFVLSGEKLIAGKVVCEKPDNNKDVWSFYLHEGSSGNILDFDFYVLIDDENFAAREIAIKPEYFEDTRTFRSAVKSIIQKDAPKVRAFLEQLTADGFSIRVFEDERENHTRYFVEGTNVRHWNKIFPVIGGPNGHFTASILVDRHGNYKDERP